MVNGHIMMRIIINVLLRFQIRMSLFGIAMRVASFVIVLVRQHSLASGSRSFVFCFFFFATVLVCSGGKRTERKQRQKPKGQQR
jgi:hypothetical protein